MYRHEFYSQQLRIWMAKHKVSMSQMATLIGRSRGAVYKWTSGKARINDHTFFIIKHIFHDKYKEPLVEDEYDYEIHNPYARK